MTETKFSTAVGIKGNELMITKSLESLECAIEYTSKEVELYKQKLDNMKELRRQYEELNDKYRRLKDKKKE